MMDGSVRIGVIAAVHHGPDAYGKAGSRALELLETALVDVQACDPDVVVDLGDRISDQDPAADIRRTREVATLWRRLGVPRHHGTRRSPATSSLPTRTFSRASVVTSMRTRCTSWTE
ncbi:hypothetical protein BH23DEI1_BH23DEI1_20830 [soil metagenome]